MPAKLMVFDRNGSPSNKYWHHFDHLLAEIVANRRMAREKGRGHDMFLKFMYGHKWQQLLSGILCVRLDNGELLNSEDLIRIVDQGFKVCADKPITDGTKTRQALVLHVEKRVNDMVAQEAEYSVVSRLSIPQGHVAMPTIEYGGIVLETLDPSRSLPNLPARLQDAQGFEHLQNWESCKYPLIISRVRTFSAAQAIQQVSRVLDLVRALATLYTIHNRSSVQITGARSEPLSKLLVGPLHLVSEDGLASFVDGYVYEERYSGVSPALSDEEKWLAVYPRLLDSLKRVAALPYSVDAENLLIRYGSAMDETRWTVALLGLWAVLEHITGTVGRDQPKMSRWATRLPDIDHRAARFIEFARCTRNRIVHSGHQYEVNEQWAHLIRPIVEKHLLRLMSQYLGVKSLDEYRQLLRLPDEIDEVSREAELRMAVVKAAQRAQHAPN